MLGKCRGFSHCFYKKKSPRFDYYNLRILNTFKICPPSGYRSRILCRMWVNGGRFCPYDVPIMSEERKHFMAEEYSSKSIGFGKHTKPSFTTTIKLRSCCSVVPICRSTLRCVFFPLKLLCYDTKRTKLYSTKLLLFTIGFFQFCPLHILRCLPKGSGNRMKFSTLGVWPLQTADCWIFN